MWVCKGGEFALEERALRTHSHSPCLLKALSLCKPTSALAFGERAYENAQAREYVRWIEAEDPRILQGFVGATVDICVEPGGGGIAVIGE